MKLGIKIAPDSDWKQDIESAHPAMVEVWYNASKPADYDDMFAYLTTKRLDVGLHYWGALSNGLLTNIAYPDPKITEPSLALIRATIDIAAKNHCRYVNMHNEMRVLMNIDADYIHASIASIPADLILSTQTFLEHMRMLKTYADDRRVVLTVETVPLRDTTDWNAARGSAQIIDPYHLPMDVSLELGRRGFALANDFAHTACNMISDDRGAVWQYLYNISKTLAPATRLIHLGFIIPPYNGIDNHDTLANPIFDTPAAIPNKKEMIELLKLFPNRDDVWILVEPKADHVKNYFLARGILENASVLTKLG
jgi:hypothetical protein